MVETTPTFPTEQEFRGYLGQSRVGTKLLDIFDRYAQGLETRYDSDVQEIPVGPVDETSVSPMVNYKGKFKKMESAALHTTDFSSSDFPSLDLTLWVEDDQLLLRFDPYAVGGDYDRVRIKANLETGEVVAEMDAAYTPDEHTKEFRKFIDRIRRLSSVSEDILGLIDGEDILGLIDGQEESG